jgi:hypothetical protein
LHIPVTAGQRLAIVLIDRRAANEPCLSLASYKAA